MIRAKALRELGFCCDNSGFGREKERFEMQRHYKEI